MSEKHLKKRMPSRQLTTKRIALSGLFLALALIVSLLENMLPPIIPMLPYAKIGLSNIILLMCFLIIGVWEGYIVLVLKCVLAAVFAGNMSALLWSLPSAFVAYTVMVGLFYLKKFSTTGLSMAGGMLHNLTQILVASVIVGKTVFAYLPYMLLAGGIAGLVTGVICHFFVERFRDKFKVVGIKHQEYQREIFDEIKKN
ncbi:MAG: Gx transporter family protein [Clostridia bacterium]